MSTNNLINQSDISVDANRIILSGTLDSALTYSHQYDGVEYYTARLKVYRSNGKRYDVIHVFIPGYFLIVNEILLDAGVRIKVEGKIVQSELHGKNDVSVVVDKAYLTESTKDENILYIGGVIYKMFDLKSVGSKAKSSSKDSAGNQRVVRPVILKHTYVQEDGKQRSFTVKISFWNNTAKLLSNSYDIGSKIFVRGQLESKAVKISDDSSEESSQKTTLVLHEASAAVVYHVN